MDVESTNLAPERRTRVQQIEPGEEIGHLRTDVLEAEERIVENINKLKEMLTPDRLANYLVSAFRDGLLVRISRSDWQIPGKVSDRVRRNLRDHPRVWAFAGLGMSGLLVYGLMKYKKDGELAFKAIAAGGSACKTEYIPDGSLEME